MAVMGTRQLSRACFTNGILALVPAVSVPRHPDGRRSQEILSFLPTLPAQQCMWLKSPLAPSLPQPVFQSPSGADDGEAKAAREFSLSLPASAPRHLSPAQRGRSWQGCAFSPARLIHLPCAPAARSLGNQQTAAAALRTLHLTTDDDKWRWSPAKRVLGKGGAGDPSSAWVEGLPPDPAGEDC